MATLLLTAVGTALGGPLGGALGALAGRQIDSAIIGTGTREGPRLKELDVTTSSYGNPVARHYGTSRSGGTIIWATELVESSESSGAGKGQPGTTTYSYSSSFAVALSSSPIESVGRIWADGNLLRGAAGDLKTGGTFRLHKGFADQNTDPLIASAEGPSAPAFRGLAYAVFEDLQLGDFGNRIPALTFEIVAGSGDVRLTQLTSPTPASLPEPVEADGVFAGLAGYAAETGSLAQHFETVGQLYPLAFDASGDRLSIAQVSRLGADTALPLPQDRVAAWDGQDYGQAGGLATQRADGARATIAGVRHYDPARDYQPGVQRLDGRAASGRASIVEFPATIAAPAAKVLTAQAARRGAATAETIAWRMAELDPAIRPGQLVTLPGRAGHYRVLAWEWRERAVELELVRHSFPDGAIAATDPGRISLPGDVQAGPTTLSAFGLPWDGNGSAGTAQMFAAVTTGSSSARASLFTVQDNGLEPAGSARGDALQGTLAAPLGPSRALRFEPNASLEVAFTGPDTRLAPATMQDLAGGANRLLVGAEIVQFAVPVPLGGGQWRLEGLLRGRGGTEAAAMAGHSGGALAVLLDERLVSLDPALASNADPAIAASGLGDAEPVVADIARPGSSLHPLTPVHGQAYRAGDGGLTLCWTRRARGAWVWRDAVDVPLVEETESYLVGIGPVDAPVVSWEVSERRLDLSAAEVSELSAAHAGKTLWVQQQGTFARSTPLTLTTL